MLPVVAVDPVDGVGVAEGDEVIAVAQRLDAVDVDVVVRGPGAAGLDLLVPVAAGLRERDVVLGVPRPQDLAARGDLLDNSVEDGGVAIGA